MSESADKQFVDLVLGEKLLTQPQVDECIASRDALAKAGIRWSLPQVVQEKGLLPRKDVRKLLEQLQGGTRAVRLAGYEILDELGHGGMGTVYKARQVNVDRIVAIKVLSRAATSDAKFVERFHREARTVASLRHRNIVAAFDSGESEGWHYMVMEMVEGLTMRKLVGRTGPLPEAQALKVAMEIADALRHAHAKGIVHRDVKPGNIILATDGTSKLCDLGMAKLTDLGDPSSTRAGQTLGTPHYMSPEQARGESDIDHRADIYSLGTTLFYMLTGEVPYKDTVPAVVMAKHITAEAPWARDVNPKVSDEASRVVAKMMAKDRASRYQNCSQVIQDLKAAIEGGILIAPTRDRQPWTKAAPVKEAPPAPVKKDAPPGPQAAGRRLAFTITTIVAVALAVYFGWCAYSASARLDRTLQISFDQAVRAAQDRPGDRVDNYRRFQLLKQAAQGTRFEPLIDEHIQKLLPRSKGFEER